MKKFKNFFVFVGFSFVLFFSCLATFNIQDKQYVNALTPDYPSYNSMPTVYYFSDSSPTFETAFDELIGLNVVYDIHPLLTHQELMFMLYSGYFWGFLDTVEENVPLIVVIELKTFRPNVYDLENLFLCLQAQNCKVFFVSPYQSEFGDLNYVDAALSCEMDEYSMFLKNVVRSMLVVDVDENGLEKLGVFNTVILVDGRFFGINGVGDLYDPLELCLTSSTWRRMLLYMYYACDTNMEVEFELSLYQDVWVDYVLPFEEFGIEFGAFNEMAILDDYINIWRTMESEHREFVENYPTSEAGAAFYEARDEDIKKYYGEILYFLKQKNLHILAHIDANQYVDLMALVGNPNGSEITDEIIEPFYYLPEDLDGENPETVAAEELYQIFSPADYRIYSMGIWLLKSSYYDVLLDIQNNQFDERGEELYPNVEYRPFIWEQDLLENTGDGLVLWGSKNLKETYGELYGDEAERAEYDFDALKEEFIELLYSLSDI